jgi:hypothetical protein
MLYLPFLLLHHLFLSFLVFTYCIKEVVASEHDISRLNCLFVGHGPKICGVKNIHISVPRLFSDDHIFDCQIIDIKISDIHISDKSIKCTFFLQVYKSVIFPTPQKRRCRGRQPPDFHQIAQRWYRAGVQGAAAPWLP